MHPEDQLEGGAIWHHLERHKIPFYNFGEGFELAGIDESKDLEPTGARLLTNVPMPDPLYRNTSRNYPGLQHEHSGPVPRHQLIDEMEEKWGKTGAELPRFLFIHLPNDHMADERPEDGYPYRESFVADNDYALGRILEYLSKSKWWKDMAVFITEDDAQGGVDHVDAQRTVLMCAGPVVQEELRLACEHELSRAAEDGFPDPAPAAAEPVRCGGHGSDRHAGIATGPDWI